ncbi:hypothetical protein ACFSLT_04025 [Novosphingobium resinovorum]
MLVAFAWARPDLLATPVAHGMRRVVGAVLLVTAITVFLRQIGIL